MPVALHTRRGDTQWEARLQYSSIYCVQQLAAAKTKHAEICTAPCQPKGRGQVHRARQWRARDGRKGSQALAERLLQGQQEAADRTRARSRSVRMGWVQEGREDWSWGRAGFGSTCPASPAQEGRVGGVERANRSCADTSERVGLEFAPLKIYPPWP